MTETQNTNAPADPWANIETADPESATKALVIPESLMTLAKTIAEARSKDIFTDGWSADRAKDFQRYMKGAAEKLGIRFRIMATQNGGRSAFRVTVMKENVSKTAPVSAPAAPAPVETPAETVETPAEKAPAKGRGK